MNIIIDAMGGDNAPLEVLKGAIKARADFDVEITLVGDKKVIQACAKENGLDLSGLQIRHAETVIAVCEDPLDILKKKKDCSMAVGMRMLADGQGDAFLSAGSTGALVVGGTMIVGRIKGIKRPAIATVMPTTDQPVMLLDCGANAECRPEMLTQFAVMGSAYMNKILHVDSPRVGLVNIGTEESKGRGVDKDAYKQLSSAPIRFIGNIEARQIPMGEADVVVTDGFTGNVLLKMCEGMAGFFSSELKRNLSSGLRNKLGAALVMPAIRGLKKKFDYSEYGGSPLLGTAKPVIKAHGSSDAKAFYHAVKQAKDFTETGVIEKIAGSFADTKEGWFKKALQSVPWKS
ncbi:MAG: phosphate acyltransferase PlsX [Oscillospiraceae bacterium]|nr:phosphate acyltransferase PlsX [Oscillospiraceae bacterium]